MTYRKKKRDTHNHQWQLSEQHIKVGDQNLPKVSEFKYLERILTADNNDWTTISKNLSKSIVRWGKVRRILSRDGANQKMMVGFYRAIVLSVLLYGAETWEYSPAMIIKLKTFHNKEIRNICRKQIHPTDKSGETRIYPSSKELLQQVNLKSIGEYIYERQNNFRTLTEDYSTMILRCKEWENKKGKGGKRNKKVWWNQKGQGDQESPSNQSQ